MKGWSVVSEQRFVAKFVQGFGAVVKIADDKFLSGVLMAIEQIKEYAIPEDWDFSFANDEPEEECSGFQAKFLEGMDPFINRELMRVCRE